jgi:hypothetical protein
MVVKTRKVLEKKMTPTVVKGGIAVKAIKKKKLAHAQKYDVKKIKIVTKKPVQNKKKTLITLKETSKAVNTKVLITDNTKPPAEIIKRASIYPLVQSPFRFPLPSSKAVSVLANSFGMVFVLIGAFFSMVHLSENVHTASYNALSNLANVIDYSIVNPNEPIYEEINTISETEGLVTEKPVPHVNAAPVSETSPGINIIITVSSAYEVKLLLSNTTNGQFYVLGSATKVDPSTWKAYWDTSKYPAGEYKIKLIIKNQFGVYEHVDTSSISVEDISATTEAELNEEQTISKAVHLTISEDNPVNGSIVFEATVQSAKDVKISLRNSDSGALYAVGGLLKKTTDLWRVSWNSGLVPDGSYVLNLITQFEDGSQTTNSDRKLIVKNGVIMDDVIKATSTLLQTELIPEKTEATAEISFNKDGNLTGFVDVNITTSPVDKVELFVIQQKATTPQFLGLAQKETETKWKFSWQTKNSPNGDYYLFARLKSAYGTFDAGKQKVTVSNTAMDVFSDEQVKLIETFNEVDSKLIKITEENISQDDSITESEVVTYVEPVSSFVEIMDVDDEVRVDVKQLLIAFRIKLNEKLSQLAKAKRDGNDADLRRIESDIETLRNEVLQTLPKGVEKKELIEEISTYLSQVTFELSEVTIKNETILRDRIGDAVTNDSDKDEILDYDEINLYKTNPFSADSDNDGYNDNVELVSGFDPLDSKTEAIVVYESPKEVGIVREDLFVVESVISIEKVSEDDQPKGLISGKALPNSFVTLYIYSTPVVVTVKTDSEGNWNYIFDKELEDGEHEVYVGITNNQGKIVAKSNPLPFIKTAEAFAGVTPEVSAATIADAEPSLINTDSLLTIASMIVLILGIVLLFLGFHLKREDVIIEEPLAV